jgi:hypothetical protein
LALAHACLVKVVWVKIEEVQRIKPNPLDKGTLLILLYTVLEWHLKMKNICYFN